MTDPLLQVSGLTVTATTKSGSSTLVDDVDFELRAGETLGVVGESGSGKSMLVKAVLSLLPPRVTSVGEVRFDGERIDQLDEKALRRLRGRRLSLLLQDPFTMLNPVQTVGATIAETLRSDVKRSRAQAKAEVVRRLGEVGLTRGRGGETSVPAVRWHATASRDRCCASRRSRGAGGGRTNHRT